MKKFLAIISAMILGLAMVSVVSAADITLGWNEVDFVSCGSDLSVSGYNIYHKNSLGGFDQINTTHIPSGTLTFTHGNVPMGVNCYAVSAFNQYGESGLSSEACAENINTPPIPDGTSITVTVTVTVTP